MKPAAVLACMLTGCTWIADFPADRMVERTDQLCFNGVDDDGDGLTDCQDWKCLDRAACCTRPSVVLEDTFETAPCASEACSPGVRTCEPQTSLWQRWGAPYPYLCEGALHIDKPDTACYPVGVLSRASFRIERGLVIDATVAVTRDQPGYVTLGLTRQAAVADGTDPCAAMAPVPTLVGIRYEPVPEGIRFSATIADVVVGQNVIVASSGTGNDQVTQAHTVSLTVTDELTVAIAIDGAILATTTDAFSAARPIDARLLIAGAGEAGRVERVRVVSGTQCETPAAWAESSTPTPVDPPASPPAWDAFERRAPNASIDADAQIHLRYAGCGASVNGACVPSSLAIGDAVAPLGSPLAHPSTPLVMAGDLGTPAVLDLAVDEADRRGYFSPEGESDARIMTCSMSGDGAMIASSVSVLLDRSEANAWDAGAICCPAIVEHDGERLLYYSGKAGDGFAWRIGLAISRANGPFERIGPVLQPGPPGSFDEHGASQPSVIYDEARHLFRMWYRAAGAFDEKSIGYAVSPDGTRWYRDPENPVLSPDQLGLTTFGEPTVIDHGAGLRMWIDGLAPGSVAHQIFELENIGTAFAR